jgi:hypothetical protein
MLVSRYVGADALAGLRVVDADGVREAGAAGGVGDEPIDLAVLNSHPRVESGRRGRHPAGHREPKHDPIGDGDTGLRAERLPGRRGRREHGGRKSERQAGDHGSLLFTRMRGYATSSNRSRVDRTRGGRRGLHRGRHAWHFDQGRRHPDVVTQQRGASRSP